ncbi:SIMPL domain-containing protein [Porticoccus sp. GXU_MW_L64]
MSTPKTNHFLTALLIAAGLATGGYFIGQTMYNAKVALNTAEAKGLAERRVRSDQANWQIQFTVDGKSKAEIPALYQQAEKHQQTIIALLQENGFAADELDIGVVDYRYQEYRDEDQNLVDQSHQLIGSISVETGKVDLVAEVRTKVNKLIATGMNISNRAPSYRFTQLNDIKPEMLREATTNARIAASEFAENAGVKVGGIRDARQGSFYVRDAGKNYGDTEKIEKDVRVVTTITFYLTD